MNIHTPTNEKQMKDILLGFAGAVTGTILWAMSNIPLVVLVAILTGTGTVFGKWIGEYLLAQAKKINFSNLLKRKK
jgi:multidrug transporter EmrE-like cation transporter